MTTVGGHFHTNFLLLLLLLFIVVCTQLEARKVDSVERNLVNSNKIFFFFPFRFLALLSSSCTFCIAEWRDLPNSSCQIPLALWQRQFDLGAGSGPVRWLS